MTQRFVRIGEVVELKYGKSLPATSRSGHEYNVYGSNGPTGYNDKAITKAPTIIIGRKGSIGEIHYSDQPCWPIDTTYYIDDFDGNIVPRWLYHRLQRLNLKALNKAVAIPGLNSNDVYELEIPLPPLVEQRRIAAILDKAHNLKAKAAERAILITALGRSLFVRRFGLPSENPHNLPIHRLVDICSPKQWPTISSKQLQAHGYPVFGANGLIGHFDRFNHSEPTVLFTCRGATCGTVNISPPNCYVTGNSMAMDDPDPGLLTTDYLAWVLRLRGMYDVISGSAQPQITRQGLEAVMIPVPPIEAQNDFSKELMSDSGMGERSRHSEDSVSKLANSLAGALLGSGS